LRIGIGLLPVPLRNVALTAMELATLHRMFPNRLTAGAWATTRPWTWASSVTRRRSPKPSTGGPMREPTPWSSSPRPTTPTQKASYASSRATSVRWWADAYGVMVMVSVPLVVPLK
jgi:hypothetical protein